MRARGPLYTRFTGRSIYFDMMEDAVCDAEGAGNASQIYPSIFLWLKRPMSFTLARCMSNCPVEA